MIKVLIVDDEYWIRENMRTIIDWRAHSYHFMEPAVDGEQALAVIRNECPNILITDICMPFLSGADLIKIVHEEFPDTVCIALSGYSEYEFVRESMVAGAIDYILKPLSADDLLNVLSKAVDWLVSQGVIRRRSGSVRELVTQVIEYIDANYTNELSLRLLSNQFHVNDSYLSKMFKQVVGENLMMYISRKRITRAIELMNQGNLNLTEIANLVGYSDYAYFNRVFRKISGKGPREFKQTNGLKAESEE